MSSNNSNAEKPSEEKQQKKDRRELVNKTLRDSCSWVASKGAELLDNLAQEKIDSIKQKTGGRIPAEVKFKVFDFGKELLRFVGALTEVDGKDKFNPTVFPFYTKPGDDKPGFSWSTIYYREFLTNKKTKDINGKETVVKVRSNSRFQSAGVKTYLAVDIKRLLNNRGIKVIDISDPDMSKKTVYLVTVFPLESNYKESHSSSNSETPDFKNDMLTEEVMAPAKEGKWVKVVKGTLEGVKENLEKRLKEVSAEVKASESTKGLVDEANDIEESITAE